MTKPIGITGVAVQAVAPHSQEAQFAVPENPGDGSTSAVSLDPQKTYAVFLSAAIAMFLQLNAVKENPASAIDGAGTQNWEHAPNYLNSAIATPGGFIGHLRGCSVCHVYWRVADGAGVIDEPLLAKLQAYAHLRFVEMPNGSAADTGMGAYTPVPVAP